MESKDNAVALDLPNGLQAGVNYKQQFVQAPNPNKPGPTNSAAKKAPSLESALKGIYYA